MYPAVYHVHLYDEVDHTERDVCGVTFAHNFTQAVQNIEDYYGNEVISLSIMFVNEEQSVIEISAEEASRLELEA